MGSTTTKGYPYPVGTDRVMDGDNAIQALAEKVDANLGVSAAGNVNITLAAANNGSITVTFPAGRFTANPMVVVTPGFITTYFASVGTVTPTSAVLTIRHYADAVSSSAVTVRWLARTDG